MSGNFAIRGGEVGRLMANAILNFHFDFLHTSLIPSQKSVQVWRQGGNTGSFAEEERGAWSRHLSSDRSPCSFHHSRLSLVLQVYNGFWSFVLARTYHCSWRQYIPLAPKGAAFHAWLGRALCGGGGGQVRRGEARAAARRRLVLHVHRLPSLHLPVRTHLLAIYVMGRLSTVQVWCWNFSSCIQNNFVERCWTGRMFRSGSHGAWLSSLGADLPLLVEIDYISLPLLVEIDYVDYLAGRD